MYDVRIKWFLQHDPANTQMSGCTHVSNPIKASAFTPMNKVTEVYRSLWDQILNTNTHLLIPFIW